MKGAFPKRPWLRLDRDPYLTLRKHVLERDGWRCQRCGRLNELHVHHIDPRSQLGEDVEENLITLCASCHQVIHSQKLKQSHL